MKMMKAQFLTANEWVFDVGVSNHDLLRAGITVRHFTRVVVWSTSFVDAKLTACQMAACGGWMPTSATYVE